MTIYYLHVNNLNKKKGKIIYMKEREKIIIKDLISGMSFEEKLISLQTILKDKSLAMEALSILNGFPISE